MSFRIAASTLITSLLVLSGCAETGTSANAQAQAEPQPIATTIYTEPSAPEPVAEMQQEQPAPVNPVIEFAEDSTQLDDAAQEQISSLLPPARRANKIVIYGYSDRNNPGDAKEIAISRALRVRTELVKNGVEAGNIRIRYSTEDARHEAKVVIAEDTLTVVDNSLAPTN